MESIVERYNFYNLQEDVETTSLYPKTFSKLKQEFFLKTIIVGLVSWSLTVKSETNTLAPNFRVDSDTCDEKGTVQRCTCNNLLDLEYSQSCKLASGLVLEAPRIKPEKITD